MGAKLPGKIFALQSMGFSLEMERQPNRIPAVGVISSGRRAMSPLTLPEFSGRTASRAMKLPGRTDGYE